MSNSSTVQSQRAALSILTHQLQKSLSWLLGVVIVVTTMGAVILAVHFGTHVDVEMLLADPAEHGHLPNYTGMYTYAGSFALLAGGAVCLFTALLLKGRSAALQSASFFVLFGVLLAWLGIDVLFMLQEWSGLEIAEFLGRGNEPGVRSKLEIVVFLGFGTGVSSAIRPSYSCC